MSRFRAVSVTICPILGVSVPVIDAITPAAFSPVVAMVRHRGDYLQVFVGGVVTQASDFAAGVVQGYPFVIKKIFDEVEPE